MLTAEAIADTAGGGQVPAAAPAWPAATGAEFHAGRIEPGDAFFAFGGSSSHGLDYADAALAAGAAFIVSDRPHPRGITVREPRELLLKLGRTARSRLTGRVIGVTGSSGKTSSKELLAALLDGRMSPGNLNTPLALACTLLRSALTAPERDLILELGIDRTGEMQELLDLTQPDAGLLTHLGPGHLDGLGDLAGVTAEKRRLIDSVPLAFVSSQAAAHLGRLPAHVRVYGLNGSGDSAAQLKADGTLTMDGADWTPPLPGSAQAENLAGALAFAFTLGVDAATARARLNGMTPPAARLQFIRLADGRLLIDDSYNSNPASARAALEVLRSSPAPHAAVLGDMRELGSLAGELHRELGRATRGLAAVIAVGDWAEDVRASNPEAVTARDTAGAARLLDRLPEHGTLLVKASRSLAFEQLVEMLVGPCS